MYLQETRIIDTDKVRVMCINNDYYTCGTYAEYHNLFCKCENNSNVLEIAEDILQHSNKERLMNQTGCSEKEVLENICFGLINHCSFTCVEIKD